MNIPEYRDFLFIGVRVTSEHLRCYTGHQLRCYMDTNEPNFLKNESKLVKLQKSRYHKGLCQVVTE